MAHTVIEANGGTVDAASMSEFDLPSYNQDEQAKAFPRGAEEPFNPNRHYCCPHRRRWWAAIAA